MQVVCPLIALAKDQVENALARNIDAEMFNSEVQVILLQPLCNNDALSLMSPHRFWACSTASCLFTLCYISLCYASLLNMQALTAFRSCMRQI